jgi:pyruvate dehydrogenase E2 component (dihydrolipoamide acetyltransferase)
MYDVAHFSAIINPPQACILAVASAKGRVLPAEDGGFRAANVMTVTLSSDHRVVDGAKAAEWGKAFKGFMEEPETMLL